MLIIIAVLAIGMAALFSAAAFWISVAATCTLALVLGSVLGAILLRAGERAFCLGFSLFAGVYLVLVEWDWIGGLFGHDLTRALGEVAERIFPAPTVSSAAPMFTQVPLERLRVQQGQVGNFVEIGRMIAALLFGIVGGYAALVMVRRREQPRPADAVSS
jgi:hypothetical protein